MTRSAAARTVSLWPASVAAEISCTTALQESGHWLVRSAITPADANSSISDRRLLSPTSAQGEASEAPAPSPTNAVPSNAYLYKAGLNNFPGPSARRERF